ncbi:MAG: hypothetical protein HXS52_11725 [Theionarchaea archaeon]|nr:hypothetical protein [Theionarchaea archaeon]
METGRDILMTVTLTIDVGSIARIVDNMLESTISSMFVNIEQIVDRYSFKRK